MLRNYFETERQRQALNVYSEFARRAHWPVREILDLYGASQLSFDASVNGDQALANFKKVYDALAGSWHAFRPHSREVCWSPQQIFETIKHEFTEFARSSPTNLLNFQKTGNGLRLESCLLKLGGIKPHQGYPVMTASKFLHFYNPRLFPIYDYEVIWKKVFGRFRKEFQDFCSGFNVAYDIGDTALFYRSYMCWGSSLLSRAHGSFMQVFVDWLSKQPGAELSRRPFDSALLYATAFEFIAIGAALD